MMRYLSASEVREALPMADAIDAMRLAFTSRVEMPLRTRLGSSLVMPGLVRNVMAVKIVSVVPGNPAGLVAVFDDDGSPLGIVDGHQLTSIRTGAVTGLATDLLARQNVKTMVMLGAGEMAPDMIEAVRAVRQVDRVLIWSRDLDRANSLAVKVGGVAVGEPADGIAEADVISCATPAVRPLFAGDVVSSGAHVNAVGAFTPDMVELPGSLLSRAYVVVDDREAAAAEAGDLIQAGREPDATLGEVLAGAPVPVDHDVTVFKSVGLAIQDVAAAHRALSNAAESGIGTILD